MADVNGTRDLAVTFRSIVEGFKQRYLIAYTPAGVPAKGCTPSKCA